MAHAGVISLKSTIARFLNSSRISLVPPSREMLEFAYEDLECLKQFLERSDESINSKERMKALEGHIIEAVYKVEDGLESRVSDQFLSHPQSAAGGEGCSWVLSKLDLRELRRDIDCFTHAVRKMMDDYTEELENQPSPEQDDGDDDDDAALSSSIDLAGNRSEMVGYTDDINRAIDQIVNWSTTPALCIYGMAGIGKTALARRIFEDPLISRNFKCRAFVKVGQKYRLTEILQAILAQVNSNSDKTTVEGDEKLYEYLCKSLRGGKYLIVLDDVWNTDFWSDFIQRFPVEDNGSLILLTTRLQQITRSVYCKTCEMPFMDEELSWDLLRRKVFGEEACPSQLEKAGRKIAENCEGLPLLILTVANLLSKAEKSPECWNRVAADKENSVFMDAYNQILKVLHPSYNYLPQYLKACFLYMGSFPQNHEVRHSRLTNLWSAEGFTEPNPLQNLEDFAMECMKELVSSNLVMDCQWSSSTNKVKAWGLHSVFWHLCKKEARNQKFLHILNNYADGSLKGIENQRHLSICKNILLGVKDVYNSIASISTARSLLCTGAYHHYQVPVCFGLRLLRVLDALTVRFYEFPMEVLKLVQLRYLALTYNGDLPPSLSKLWNLQYLIVYQHLSIKWTVAESYLPVEIWDLQNLKYLHIMGRNLPDPHGAVLPNLLTLLDVGAHSCTKGVLESVPNLEKLRVQIELAPDATEFQGHFDHTFCLYKLKSFHFIVMNPKLSYEVVTLAPSLSFFPFHLKKLTLSGSGYPWRDMRKIAESPFLEVLKLQCYAFSGEKWEAIEKAFLKLRYLLIEDTDLVRWTARNETFPVLWYLIMKNCYKLNEIPHISSLRDIQLIECNPSAVTSAKQMEGYSNCVHASSSWDVGNLKS